MQFHQALRHSIFWRSAQAVLLFIVNLLLVRLLGAAGSGSFLYAITWLSFFTLIISGCLESGMLWLGGTHPATTTRMLRDLLPVWLLQVLVSWGVLSFWSVGISTGLAIVFVASQLVIVYATAVLTLQRRLLWAYMIPVWIQAILMAVLGWMWWSSRVELDVATIYVGGFALQALLLLLGVSLKLNHSHRETPSDWRRQWWRFSLLALGSNMLFFLVLRADYAWVAYWMDPVALGNYVQVSRLGQLLVMPASMLAAVVFPYAAAREVQATADSVLLLTRTLALLYGVGGLLLLLMGYWLFPALFGAEFNQVFMPLVLAYPGFVALGWLSVLGAFVSAQGNQRVHVWANATALVILIVLDGWMIPQYGLAGAALVSSVAYFAAFVWVYRVFRRQSQTSFRMVWQWRFSDWDALRGLFQQRSERS